MRQLFIALAASVIAFQVLAQPAAESVDYDLDISAAVDRAMRPRWALAITPGVTYLDYREPGRMTDKGTLFGAQANLVYRPLSDLSVELRGGYFAGGTRYEGSLINLNSGALTPYSAQSKNSIGHLDLVGRIDLPTTARLTISPALGATYYKLTNPRTSSVSYDRAIRQLYLVVEPRADLRLSSTITVSAWVGAMVMAAGTAKTGESGVLQPMSFEQDNGMGWRLGAGYRYRLKDGVAMTVALAWERHAVANSKTDVSVLPNGRTGIFVEPRNVTHLTRVSAGFVF